jgi:hypothetical protein
MNLLTLDVDFILSRVVDVLVVIANVNINISNMTHVTLSEVENLPVH